MLCVKHNKHMKLVKEIKNMYDMLPPIEKEIFDNLTININNFKTHKQKEIIYNLLLWRRAECELNASNKL